LIARLCSLFVDGESRGRGKTRVRLVAVVAAAVLTLAGCETKVRSPEGGVQAAIPPAEPVVPPGAMPVEIAPLTSEPLPQPPTTAETIRVAVLLPLSGPHAALGRALLDAAQLALFDLGDERLELLPRDTGGTAEGAAAAVEDVLSVGVRLIVGPVFAAETAAVAPRAQAAGINVLSLSNDLSVAAPGVFVLGVTPRLQIERVLTFARARGLSRYAALLPNDSYGDAVEAALYETAGRIGGQITAIERYEPGAADISPVVRRLASYEQRRAALERQRRELERRNDEISRQALRRLDGIETLGEVPFDSVLLPDFGDRLLAIAPLLPYYDIDPSRVRFLGTTLWDDPRITREPALIGGWFAAPPPEARDGFVKRYRAVYRQDPPRIATIIYDAVAMAAVLARDENGANYSVEALTNPVGFAGMDGVFRLRPDGSVDRNLAVLEVQRNGFRTVSPAAESFETPTQ